MSFSLIDKLFEPRSISCLSSVIVRVRVVFRKTVVGDWHFTYLSGSHLQSQVKSRLQMMVHGTWFGLVSFVVMWLVVKTWKLQCTLRTTQMKPTYLNKQYTAKQQPTNHCNFHILTSNHIMTKLTNPNHDQRHKYHLTTTLQMTTSYSKCQSPTTVFLKTTLTQTTYVPGFKTCNNIIWTGMYRTH